jgi:hypothetical protein
MVFAGGDLDLAVDHRQRQRLAFELHVGLDALEFVVRAEARDITGMAAAATPASALAMNRRRLVRMGIHPHPEFNAPCEHS